MRRFRNAKDEGGAIIIEAIIALTVYIFTIFTILSIVDICYTQARISIALNSAARDLSKYSYLYYKFNGDQFQQDVAAAAGDSKEMSKNIVTGSGNFINELTGTADVTNFDELEAQLGEIKEAGSSLGDDIKTMADSFADDPSGFMKAMGLMVMNEGLDEGKNIIGQAMARAFMKKNLKSHEDDDPNAFLKRHHVVDGMDGLDFEGTSFMVGGADDEIILSVTYEIKVIQLLDVDYSIRIWQTAKTTAWGNGVSNEVTTETETETE